MQLDTSARPAASSRFRADLAQSGAVWTRNPGLPLATLALAVASELLVRLDGRVAYGPLGLVSAALMAGWVGTQRIWYLRAFRSERISGRELVSLTAAFLPRFVVLGALVTLPNLVLITVLARLWPDPRTLLTAWFVFPLVTS